jgi:tRNA (guanine-N(7)-)-methyltransferase subunit TRM82
VSAKKTSAAALTNDSRHVIYGDKFGDVCIGTTRPQEQQQQQQQQQHEQPQQQRHVEDPAPLLGHMQSIVTAVVALPGDQLVVTTDRDAKVRVSVLQQPQPLLGSFEIQSYCLGHREFVACAAAVLAPPGAAGDGPAGGALLLTGGGDGCVKLWDPVSGQLLSSYTAATEEEAEAAAAAELVGCGEQEEGAAEQAGASRSALEQGGDSGGEGAAGDEAAQDGADDGQQQEQEPRDQQQHQQKGRKALLPVVAIALSIGGDLAAVLVEGRREVQLVRVDAAARSLGPCLQRLALPPDVLAPCRAAFDEAGRLWLVGGPPVAVTQSAHVAVAAPAAEGGGDGSGGFGAA